MSFYVEPAEEHCKFKASVVSCGHQYGVAFETFLRPNDATVLAIRTARAVAKEEHQDFDVRNVTVVLTKLE